MNKRIRTYEDLLEEQQRLMSQLKTHEAKIKVDVAGVKEGIKPLNKAITTINKLATRDNTAPMMNFGLEMGTDLLIRKLILSRAGWFTKIVVPFLIKNYSSHLVGEEKREALINKVKSFFKKIRPEAGPAPQSQYRAQQKAAEGNGQVHTAPKPAATTTPVTPASDTNK